MKYIGELNWIQIIDKISSNPNDWKVAINAEGDICTMEIFKFIPNLLVAIYESDK